MASTRPRVFLDITIGTEPAGRLTFELFNDKAPKTCDNFRALCTGAHPPLTYKLSPFHRVIDEFMIQGGDITNGDGTGGDSIYGGEFEDENLDWRAIDSAGLLCMANRGKATNSSQFFVTLAPCTHLNGKHTVFGSLISGQDALDRIAKTPVDAFDKPTSRILICHCGELERRKKPLPDPPRLRPSKRSSYNSTVSLDSQSTDRGRAKRRRRSPAESDSTPKPSRSRSASPTRHGQHRKQARPASPSPAPPPDPNARISTRHRSRRSSDHSVDETLRGRQRCRPDDRMRMSPAIEEDSQPSDRDMGWNGADQFYGRRRSPSPSRHRERSVSTGFRRRRSLPNHYERRMEDSRSRVDGEDRERFDGHEMEWDGAGQSQGQAHDSQQYNNWRRDRPVQRNYKHADEGRLGYDDGGGDDDGGGGIRFKGRGSMKYRERRW